MQLSLLIGKQIVTPAGKRLGYVTGAYLDRDLKRLTALSVADENEEEFFLSTRAVLSYGDAVIARENRLSSPVGVPSPVGLPAFSERGASLGTVGDFLFGDVDAVLILVKDGVRASVPADCVLADETVIVYASPELRPVRRPLPEKKRPERMKKPAKPEQSDGEQEGTFRCNLLGRKVKLDVYDSDGEVLFAAGELITAQTLSVARRKNRLLALAVNTLTNLV